MSNDDLYHSLVRRGDALSVPTRLPGQPKPHVVDIPLPAQKVEPKPTAEHAVHTQALLDQAARRLAAIHSVLGQVATDVTELDRAVGYMTNSLFAPGTELAEARVQIEKLQREKQSVIAEARRQKNRADKAEAQLPEAERTNGIVFLRRTPGDAIRYFSNEIIKHADNHPFLVGSAMGLRMVADDVDGMPQR
ncbi:hypothetical protein [Streptomyces sp. cg35]|uniref:hypothetical protein n=1 Tax=Streptomyces sp. cg35 TaxID=3421650 RepID=UPI003D1747BF